MTGQTPDAASRAASHPLKPNATKSSSASEADSGSSFDFRVNNFDAVRLLAALQVVIVHGYEHLQITGGEWLISWLRCLPGVPIFFVVSGFLVSASYERSRSLLIYGRNRIFRVYPALWACFACSLLSVFIFYDPTFTWPALLSWIAAQLTIAQFYNPDFLRGYGVGTLNGSLWTIPVELQFYFLLPAMYFVLRRLRWQTIALVIAMLVGAGINQGSHWLATGPQAEQLSVKLLGVSVLPWLYLFLLGVVLQRNLGFVRRYLAGQVIPWTIALLAVGLLASLAGWSVRDNSINPLSAVTLGCLTIAVAYRPAERIRRWFRGFDISYGVYLYHMVVVNVLVEHRQTGNIGWLLLMTGVTITLATISWKLLERPILQLKSAPAGGR